MGTLRGKVRRSLLGSPPGETSFERRGFGGATEVARARLERVGSSFIQGYHSALEVGSLESLACELSRVELELRGFAFEGAAVGLALLDCLTPWRPTRLARFLAWAGEAHAYMIHVGVGWVWARMPWSVGRTRKRLDPLLCWLAFDGWGFHEGFFRWPEYVKGKPAPKRLRGYERRAFDQGLGRSWWFVNGANPDLIAATIAGFPPERQPDMWSGAGLAAVYAGMVSVASLAALRSSAGPHWRHLAQGAAFAAKARQRAGNSTEYTDFATRMLCGLPAVEAARLSDTALESLPANGPEPAYEIWRQRIQHHFKGTRQLQEA